MNFTYDTREVKKYQQMIDVGTAEEKEKASRVLRQLQNKMSDVIFKFWTPVEDNAVNDDNITLHKKYEIFEDYIIDDSGEQSGIFLGHDGIFQT